MATPHKTSAKKTAGGKGADKKAGAASAKRSGSAAKPVAGKPPSKTKETKGKTEVKTPAAARASKKETPKKKPAPATKAPATPPEPKIAKAVVDPEWLKAIREALVQQRQRLLSLVQSTAAQMAERTGDLPDVSDRASEGYSDELATGLLAIEAGQLDEIEWAIRRIDDGSYGLCIDCGRPIPRKRLEILPFAHRCLNCKGARERQRLGAEGLGEEEGEGRSDADTEDADTEDHE